MIGKLTGRLDSVKEDLLLLDVAGVGYEVHCSRRTLSQCGQAGEALSLLIDTHVREDEIRLFGFIDAAEQHWFRLLYSVQGVGPKAALSILSVCAPDKLGFAIASEDKAVLTQAEGVGPKLAVRILTELKDKAAKMDVGPLPPAKGSKAAPAGAGVEQDAVSALINLGYARSDAFSAVMQVRRANDNAVLEDLIRLALKELSA